GDAEGRRGGGEGACGAGALAGLGAHNGPLRAEGGARLPVGKLPGQLLARLIAGYATTDPTVIVGPGIGGDAAAIDLGATTLVVTSGPDPLASDSPGR